MKYQSTTLKTLSGFLILLILILQGCGSGAESSDSGETSETTSAETVAQPVANLPAPQIPEEFSFFLRGDWRELPEGEIEAERARVKKLADAGDAAGLWAYAKSLDREPGDPREVSMEMRDYAEKAAEKNVGAALEFLFLKNRFGLNGFEKSQEKARKYLEQALASSDTKVKGWAHFQYGEIYSRPADPMNDMGAEGLEKAAFHFNEAAKLHYLPEMVNQKLAEVYDQLGNKEGALQSLLSGSPEDRCKAGFMLVMGNGVGVDVNRGLGILKQEAQIYMDGKTAFFPDRSPIDALNELVCEGKLQASQLGEFYVNGYDCKAKRKYRDM